MNNGNFQRILSYLDRTRIWNILYEKDNNEWRFSFVANNKYEEKNFTILYADSNHEIQTFYPRPFYHYYYLMFEQPNVCMRTGDLGTVFEHKWYQDEEDVLYRIKQLMNRRYR